MKSYHYYLLDRVFYRVPVISDRHIAEQYLKNHHYLPADRQQIQCYAKRITWEDFIRGITTLDMASIS